MFACVCGFLKRATFEWLTCVVCARSFTEAIGQSKLNSDLIWTGAALEGAAEAVLLAKMPALVTAPVFNITPDSHREVQDTFSDAIGFYNKRKVVSAYTHAHAYNDC